jgi:hypothetical protein
MADQEDRQYAEGRRETWRELLTLCLNNLGAQERHEWQWLAEREQAIARLRIVCDYVGDNDWDEDLHLADIIENHLLNHVAT